MAKRNGPHRISGIDLFGDAGRCRPDMGCAKATVWRWQARFITAGIAGLLQDKSGPPGKTPLPKGLSSGVVDLTFDYKRRGTTTLFAAFDVLDGTVIGDCMQRHRHQAPGVHSLSSMPSSARLPQAR
jgi:hypothetical protein